MRNFNLFKNFISQSRIADFTTIVRTGNDSLDFDDKNCDNEEWQKLLSSLEKSNDDEKVQFSQIIGSCSFIQIDNPPLPKLESFSNNSENTRSIHIESLATYNEERRSLSRKKLLDHLKDNCQSIYELEGWGSVYQRVVNYMKEKEEIERKISGPEKQFELRKSQKKFADEMSVRLGISSVAVESYIEVGLKNPHCCSIS
jgi:hypothetical protein